jgi:hypothetical protein
MAGLQACSSVNKVTAGMAAVGTFRPTWRVADLIAIGGITATTNMPDLGLISL